MCLLQNFGFRVQELMKFGGGHGRTDNFHANYEEDDVCWVA